ncbi:MAG TPA: acyl-CoA desaturase [Candidatus Poseidoniaceae archaeon]|nr:acyl-CoA desaturase [Candidatus Poseidoniaceae archaeon]
MSDSSNLSETWKIDILNASFLGLTPILAIVGIIWYSINYGISWAEISILFFMYLASGLSITAGYHRLFSHRSHSASWPLRLFYAVFGAAAFQNSAIKWCSDHRRHHLKTDSDEDPYSIVRGFFWAHMGWVMISEHEERIENVEDLQLDPILIWQDNHIFKIGGFAGIILPGLVGALIIGGFSGFLGGLIWGGLLRLVIVHHGTFLINSGAHYWGKQNYSTKNTSKDSPILSLFTFGEGYHNFHHTFQADYRNGHKWYHWDPTKWWIRIFSMIKITKDLHKVPSWTIEDARMKTSYEHKEKNGIDLKYKDDFKKRMEECSKQMRVLLKDISNKRLEYKKARKIRKLELKETWIKKKSLMKLKIKEAKNNLSLVRMEFKYLMKEMKIQNKTTSA